MVMTGFLLQFKRSSTDSAAAPAAAADWFQQDSKRYKLGGQLFFTPSQRIKFCPRFLLCLVLWRGDRGGTVVRVLCYKSEGRWFDPSWCH